MFSRRILCLLPTLVCASPGPAQEDGDGFVSLFNGRGRDGWVNVARAPDTWSAVDGMLRGTGEPTGTVTLPVDGIDTPLGGKSAFAAGKGPAGLWFEGGKAICANIFVRAVEDGGNGLRRRETGEVHVRRHRRHA